MIPHKLILPTLLLCTGLNTFGQVITTTPIYPTKKDTITLFYHSDLGNGALKGIFPIYAHTGIITSKSITDTDWQHVVGTWGETDTKVLMTSVSPNIYEMVIPLQSFYGFDDQETIIKLAFVFRNADGDLVGRDTEGSDLYVKIYDDNAKTSINTSPNTDLEDTSETIPIHYSISGIIENVEDANVYLTRLSESGIQIVNTGQLMKGEFKISGSLDVPENFTLMIGENDWINSIPIFLGADSVSIAANFDNLREAEISGAPLNEEVRNYFKTHYFNHTPEQKNDSEMGELNTPVSDFNNGFISPQFINREKTSLFKYVEEHPASPISPYLVLQSRIFFEFSYNELMTLDAYFDSSLNKSPDLIILRNNMSQLEEVSIDKKFTDFTLPDTSGSLINISDYDGKCILLDFWASWCKPCFSQFSALKNTFQKYEDNGFTVIAVSFDHDYDHWKQAILDEQLNWVHLSAPKAWDSEISKLYVIGGIPSNILIAPDGTIVGRNLQPLELNERLTEIFGY